MRQPIAIGRLFVAALGPAALFGMLAVAPPASAQAQTAKDVEYQGMLRRLRAGDYTINFTKMRHLWTLTSAYRPYAGALQERSVMIAFGSGKYHEVLRLSAEIQKQNYLNLLSHMLSSGAHARLGNSEAKRYHDFVARGVILSLRRSGDGRSTATAFKIVSFTEQRRLLQMLKLRKTGQSLVRANGRAYDRIAVQGARGPGVVYFDVTPLVTRGRR